MNRAFDALTNTLARTLEPGEREVVLGDLAEAKESGAHAAAQVFGLVVRRQAGLRNNWRAWLAVALTIPSILILSGVAGRMSHLATIYGWLYLANWEPAYLSNAGARADFLRYGSIALGFSMAVAAWSWAAGFVAGSLSRRAAPAVAMVAIGVLFALEPRSSGVWRGTNAAAFASMLGKLIPLATEAGLVMAPAMSGLTTGARVSMLLPESYGKPRRWFLAGALAMTLGLDWWFWSYR